MTREYLPKGYNSWREYTAKRRARKEKLKVLAFVSLMFLAYILMGYMECL